MIKLERLQKVIAQSGITSRRKAEQYILDGRVKVNGQTVTELGTKVSQTDEVMVDNVPIEKEAFVYYLLYKPREYITSVQDDKGRATVLDLMPEVTERIFPVGRLDYQTSGVLLLTNDGDFAHKLMHPRHGVLKEYVAKVEGIVKTDHLNRMLSGIEDDGEVLQAINYKIKSVNRKTKTSIVEVTLREGKNRHIRRMMEALGHPVMKLKREKFGMMTVNDLQAGKYRPLTRQEIHHLMQNASQNVK